MQAVKQTNKRTNKHIVNVHGYIKHQANSPQCVNLCKKHTHTQYANGSNCSSENFIPLQAHIIHSVYYTHCTTQLWNEQANNNNNYRNETSNRHSVYSQVQVCPKIHRTMCWDIGRYLFSTACTSRSKERSCTDKIYTASVECWSYQINRISYTNCCNSQEKNRKDVQWTKKMFKSYLNFR